MKALRWHARGDVRVDDVPTPRPGQGDVLLHVDAAGVCGTDLDEVRHGPITVPVVPHPISGRMAPMVLGHEMIGTVVAAGPGADLAIGTRVAPWALVPCGVCRDCRTGHANRCADHLELGMTLDGGMAEYVVVAAARCVPIAEETALERAVLVEPFAVALHATHLAPIAGARVAVVGIGTIGLCAVEAALGAGAAEVVALTRSERGRRLALEAGAAAAFDPGEAMHLDADVVFEAAGEPAAIQAAIAAARRGGHVLVLGGHHGPVPLDLLDVTVREITIQGSVSHCFAEDFAEAARLIDEGRLARTARPMIGVSLEQAVDLLRGGPPLGKIVIYPGVPAAVAASA